MPFRHCLSSVGVTPRLDARLVLKNQSPPAADLPVAPSKLASTFPALTASLASVPLSVALLLSRLAPRPFEPTASIGRSVPSSLLDFATLPKVSRRLGSF